MGKKNIKGHRRMTGASKQSLYSKTKKGVIVSIYGGQLLSSKKAKFKKPTYTRQDLEEWLMSQKLFHELYDLWVASGYDRWQKPSVNRKDDYCGYSMSNIEIMTWRENNNLAHSDRKNGINNKDSYCVKSISRDGDTIVYHSIEEASRLTGIDSSNISAVLKKRRKSAGKLQWKRI